MNDDTKEDELSGFLSSGVPESNHSEEDTISISGIPTKDDVLTTPMPEDIKNWVLGKTVAPPAAISTMMVNVTNKIGMYVAYLITRRLSAIDSFVSHLEGLEKQIFSPARSLEAKTIKEVKSEYSQLTSILESFLEFSRKFSSQAEDIIKDPERDELVKLIRALDPESVKGLMEHVKDEIRRKGRKGTLLEKDSSLSKE